MVSAPQFHSSIAVVIAVKDGEPWIGRSVASALAQPETAEVLVVDDGSRDGTVTAARAMDDGTGRLRVISLDRNRGPSAARNRALALVTAPFVAILDADDFLLPGRFGKLVSGIPEDWDMVADDIILVQEDALTRSRQDVLRECGDLLGVQPAAERWITAVEFILENLGKEGPARRELGFLKPVMRREFLLRHGLSYREDVRLGEDYALYVEALMAGARFRFRGACGYVAVVRGDSLSGRHGAADHARLAEVDRDLIRKAAGQPEIAEALRRHLRHVLRKFNYREVLDVAQANGRHRAIAALLRRPASIPYIVTQTLRAKFLTETPDRRTQPGVRLLIGGPADAV